MIAKFEQKNSALNIHRFYAPESDKAAVFSAVSAVSLFSDEKLVIVTDLSGNKELQADIQKLIDLVDDSTMLIIVETNPDKRSSYYKTLKKTPGFEEFSELSEEQLIRFTSEYVKKSDGEISVADARLLVERVGLNQTIIERELTKLLLFNPKISRDTILDLTVQTPQSTIFNLVDSAFSGNVTAALKLYDEQRALRKEPQAIFGMLVWQMHVVAVVLAAGNKNPRAVAEETGMNAYSLQKAQNIARRMGHAKMEQILSLLRDIDYVSKKQTYDLDDALKHVIVRLAY